MQSEQVFVIKIRLELSAPVANFSKGPEHVEARRPKGPHPF